MAALLLLLLLLVAVVVIVVVVVVGVGVGGVGGVGVDVPGYRCMHEKLLVMMMKNVKASKSANGKRCSESAVVVVVKGRRIASQPCHAHSTLMMIKCEAEAPVCCERGWQVFREAASDTF